MVENQQLLVPADVYLRAGAHIGTKYKTKYMEEFIYKTRPDGLSVLNIPKMDQRLRIAIRFLSQYAPDEILVACQRENGWDALRMLHKITGIKVYPGRYPPGILTNHQLKNFTEVKVMFVVDPWADRNAVNDAMKMGIPIIGFVDTNNTFNKLDLVIPLNNKGRKSLNLAFYLIAKEYAKARGLIDDDSKIPITTQDILEDNIDLSKL